MDGERVWPWTGAENRVRIQARERNFQMEQNFYQVENVTMGHAIDRIANACGSYLVELGQESSRLMNYQSWLVLSAIAVVVGFVLLRKGP